MGYEFPHPAASSAPSLEAFCKTLSLGIEAFPTKWALAMDDAPDGPAANHARFIRVKPMWVDAPDPLRRVHEKLLVCCMAPASREWASPAAGAVGVPTTGPATRHQLGQGCSMARGADRRFDGPVVDDASVRGVAGLARGDRPAAPASVGHPGFFAPVDPGRPRMVMVKTVALGRNKCRPAVSNQLEGEPRKASRMLGIVLPLSAPQASTRKAEGLANGLSLVEVPQQGADHP